MTPSNDFDSKLISRLLVTLLNGGEFLMVGESEIDAFNKISSINKTQLNSISFQHEYYTEKNKRGSYKHTRLWIDL